MNDLEAPNLLRPSDALNRVQGVLLDRSRNPMERLHAVWADLQHVDLEELPPALRRDWSALAARARRLAEVDLQSAEAADFGEAADIASIVLCLEWLLFQNIRPAMESYPMGRAFRHFPVTSIHAHAARAAEAAEAAEAAAAQGKFWQMHKLLFANQAELDDVSLVRHACNLHERTRRIQSDEG